jgi:GNAT superfamily N-acetyltransferase
VIEIRRARPADAAAIGAVHVAAWRSAYPGILPDTYLARLSVTRQAAYYDRMIRASLGVHVATAPRPDNAAASMVVGFVTSGLARATMDSNGTRLAEGEIETLYVLDGWRDNGLGRALLHFAAEHLVSLGCASAFLWVLRDNPARWFYAHLGGLPAAEATVQVGGADVVQTAYVWSPIDKLAQATSPAS